MTDSHLRRPFLLACLLAVCAGVSAAEKVTIAFGGKSVRCEVVKFVKSRSDELQMQLKMDGTEQTLPLRLFSKDDVRKCYDSLPEKSAALRFDMGSFYFSHEQLDDAQTELQAAVKADPSLKAKADPILQKIQTNQQIAKVADIKKTEPATPVVAIKEDKPKKDPGTSMEDYPDDPKSAEDFMKKFSHAEVPPKSDAEMKDWLAKRLEELNKLGGKWRLIETKHFYCFADIDEQKHKLIATEWNEKLYTLLCEVLRHKEGDKLWNNKMPIYYFDTYRLFQRFAGQIDGSPGAAYSGGYFSARGRDVHICIPFMSERYGVKNPKTDDSAHNTLYHEGTHAFLQLTGEDVHLNRWLHEGMAQFIEFWYEKENSPDRHERLGNLSQYTRKSINSWAEMEERPGGGTDLEGYCYAWSRLEFLFRNFDNQCLPSMIKLIKSGKTEKEAMETVFKMPVEKLEAGYRIWLPGAIKRNFKN